MDEANKLYDDYPNRDKLFELIQDMALSERTVHDRTIIIASQVKGMNAALFFSLALDE